ncbi:RES domain-containing protein [Cryobacterium sp. Y11]|uniref:RES domain-containing protein n=1 Tax=Cryobacterium sp. Y11 TaxID=2045016 RepID=UPI000CE576BC|nr:RES domain-containing protein [Cryobacterium sp. Y11]
MELLPIRTVDAAHAAVWRIGRAPEPWMWVDKEYAFTNRWDDIDRVFRTVYAGDSRYACFVEVLAYARPDRVGDVDVVNAVGIVEDPDDLTEFPVPPASEIPRDWFSRKRIGFATLDGVYADVRASQTIAALRPHFLRLADKLGYPDFDAAALKSAEPRELTQRVAKHLYAHAGDDGRLLLDGVRFASRHGDELAMWAIFERPGDDPISRQLSPAAPDPIFNEDDDLLRAFQLHRLRWKD